MDESVCIPDEFKALDTFHKYIANPTEKFDLTPVNLFMLVNIATTYSTAAICQERAVEP